MESKQKMHKVGKDGKAQMLFGFGAWLDRPPHRQHLTLPAHHRNGSGCSTANPPARLPCGVHPTPASACSDLPCPCPPGSRLSLLRFQTCDQGCFSFAELQVAVILPLPKGQNARLNSSIVITSSLICCPFI